ncbi:MAG: hypothetical protein HYZ53_19370 [Planctomycetes bacterium]|nr:hypothetical protein [Planctomycetota bacterium]
MRLAAIALSILVLCSGGRKFGPDLASDDVERAAARGRAFLLARQAADGSFAPAGAASRLRLGVTALAALVLEGETQHRAVAFLRACQRPDGLVADRLERHPWGAWEHAYATFAFARSPEARVELERAVGWILRAQAPDGSWSYFPQPADGYVQSGIQASLLEALLLARRRGVAVPASVLARAADYLEKQQLSEGAFRNHEFQQPTYEVSAVAVAALAAMGRHPSLRFLETRDARAFLQNLPEATGGDRCACYDRGYHLFGLFWTTVAYRRAGDDDRFERWFAEVAAGLLRAQRPDGGWDGWFGPEYATALALLTLESYEGAPGRWLE